MYVEKAYLRYYFFCEFLLDRTAAGVNRSSTTVSGWEAPSERKCKNWLKKFKNSDLSLNMKMAIVADFEALLKPV
jgi:hypothetical protein